jgi:long-chain fatty acid transport protein
MTKKLTMRLIPALMMFGFAGVANAAGLAVTAQTGSGMGNAFAGAAAAAEDAGTIYANPAGMTYLPKGHSISLSGTLLNRSVDFKNQGSTAALGFLGHTSNGGDAGGLSLIPAGYWAYSVAPDVWFGVGVSPTFGNKTEYNKEFIGRAAGYFSEVKQININPSLAIKVNDFLSLGLGFDLAHASLHGRTGLTFSATALQEVETESWGVGANIGAMFQLSPSTRVGLAYRSGMDFDMDGKQTMHPNVGGVLVTQKVTIDGYKTPGNLSLAVSQKLSDKWEMLGDLTWTDWSVWNQLQAKQKSNAANIGNPTVYNFKDTFRLGLGANYGYSDALKLRFGVAFDQGAVNHNADRTMTLPDNDRTWLSFGGKYAFSKTSSLDVGYSHIWVKDGNTAKVANQSGFINTIRGKFEQSADYLSVQYNHTF